MKKLFVLFLTAVFLIGIITSFNAQAAEFSVYSTTQFLNKVKTQGRTAVVDNTLMLDWSASGIEFNADCSGDVLITVNTSRIKGGTKGGLYFTVIVDGVVQYENKRVPEDNNGSSWTSNSTGYPFHITKTGESIFTIARNLSKGKHNFKIYNQTEAHHGTFGIKSISLNGKFTAPPKNNDLYIEFVGDSIIAGLGNISKGGQNQEDPLYQDATRGWAYLTANKLKADWSVVARSGITAGNGFGWSGAASVSMQKVYPKERYYSDEILPYAFERQPDVIVLGLGTNDMWTYSNYGATINDVKIGFKDILDLIRNHNPQSKIVWVYGMMTNSANDLVKQAVSDLGGSEKEYYTLELPTNTYGGQGHPDINAQTVYAEKVSKYINQLLNRNITEDNLSSNISSDTVSSNLQQNSTTPNQPQNNTTSTYPSVNVSSGTSSQNNESNDDKNNSVENTNQETTKEQKNIFLLFIIIGIILIIVIVFVLVTIRLKKKEKRISYHYNIKKFFY